MNFVTVCGSEIEISINNKLSIKCVSDAFNIRIENKIKCLTELHPSFLSTEINEENEALLNGSFELSNGMIISGLQALNLQQQYLAWEDTQLCKKNVTFKVPLSKEDCKGGVAPYNPYFFAIINKLARTSKNFDLKGVGEYLSQREIDFVHQYCSFHPALRQFLSIKDDYFHSDRTMIPCKIFELMVESALAHVEGYRDKIRFKALYESRALTLNKDGDDLDTDTIKFLMENEHVLDSLSIWSEDFDFYSNQSSGGFLDMLNLPFQV